MSLSLGCRLVARMAVGRLRFLQEAFVPLNKLHYCRPVAVPYVSCISMCWLLLTCQAQGPKNASIQEKPAASLHTTLVRIAAHRLLLLGGSLAPHVGQGLLALARRRPLTPCQLATSCHWPCLRLAYWLLASWLQQHVQILRLRLAVCAGVQQTCAVRFEVRRAGRACVSMPG